MKSMNFGSDRSAMIPWHEERSLFGYPDNPQVDGRFKIHIFRIWRKVNSSVREGATLWRMGIWDKCTLLLIDSWWFWKSLVYTPSYGGCFYDWEEDDEKKKSFLFSDMM